MDAAKGTGDGANEKTYNRKREKGDLRKEKKRKGKELFYLIMRSSRYIIIIYSSPYSKPSQVFAFWPTVLSNIPSSIHYSKSDPKMQQFDR